MKVKTLVKDKKFEPIDITITVESKEELAELWHRFNVPTDTCAKQDKEMYKYYSNSAYEVWNYIDKILNKL